MDDLAQQNLIDFNHFPCGCLIVAQDNRIVLSNHYFTENLGWDVQALTGQSVGILFNKPTQLFCESYVIPTVLSEGRCCEVQVSLTNSDGVSVPKVASVCLMPDGNLVWIFLEAEHRNRLFGEFESAQQALQEQREQLELLALTDSLTGLANRRELERSAHHVIQRASRSCKPVSVLMLDVDHFKTINDSYGHEAGDRALAALADVLKSVCRKGDIVARLGGDEFACVLADTDLSAAEALCDRIYKAVGKIENVASPFTVSIGIAKLEKNSEIDLHGLLKQADNALYAAKRARPNSPNNTSASH